jgi:hypothetical protein
MTPIIGENRFPLVDRGDTALPDFMLADLTSDGEWHDLDLSDIIPKGASFAFIQAFIQDEIVGSYIAFRKKGYTGDFNADILILCVANCYARGTMFIPLGSDRVIQYQMTNTVFSSAAVTVRGWFI